MIEASYAVIMNHQDSRETEEKETCSLRLRLDSLRFAKFNTQVQPFKTEFMFKTQAICHLFYTY